MGVVLYPRLTSREMSTWEMTSPEMTSQRDFPVFFKEKTVVFG